MSLSAVHQDHDTVVNQVCTYPKLFWPLLNSTSIFGCPSWGSLKGLNPIIKYFPVRKVSNYWALRILDYPWKSFFKKSSFKSLIIVFFLTLRYLDPVSTWYLRQRKNKRLLLSFLDSEMPKRVFLTGKHCWYIRCLHGNLEVRSKGG